MSDEAEYDVLVVGGGITGASASEALVRAGFRVLLAECHDFGSGTTSRSTRMLHCGFRSLEGLAGKPLWSLIANPKPLWAAVKGAREHLHGRRRYTSAFPARCRPVTLSTPLLKGGIKGHQMDMAAMLLAVLGKGQAGLGYKRQSLRQAGRAQFGEWLANRDDVVSVVSFTDHVFDWPERLCVDIVLAAENCGATVLNYTRVERLQATKDGWEAVLSDAGTGTTKAIQARLVLNTTGAWSPSFIRGLLPTSSKASPSSKGSQIAVKLPDGYAGHGFVESTSKGPFFLIPSRDLHIIGATNTPFDGDPAKVQPTEAEIAELLDRANQILPGIALDRKHVTYATAGLRTGIGGSPARHVIDHESQGLNNLVSVVGGNIGTSHIAARMVCKLVGDKLGRGRMVAAPRTQVESGSMEHARSLGDTVLRRTGEAWDRNFTRADLETLASAIGAKQEWDAKKTRDEVMRFENELLVDWKRDLDGENARLATPDQT